MALSSQAIREAAEELRDKSLRGSRVILWGKFSPSSDPMIVATSVFNTVIPGEDSSKIRACWLRAKQGKPFKGILVSLPSCTQVPRLIAGKALIKKQFGEIRNVSPDLTLGERKIHKARRQLQAPPPLDAKLLNSPKVLVTPLPIN